MPLHTYSVFDAILTQVIISFHMSLSLGEDIFIALSLNKIGKIMYDFSFENFII